jgi:uncharacterized protein
MKKFAIVFFTIISINAYSASYDCDKATNPTDIAVCSDIELSKKDEENASLYKNALKINKSEAETIRRHSYAEKMNCGSNIECLENIYNKSISEYANIIETTSNQPIADSSDKVTTQSIASNAIAAREDNQSGIRSSENSNLIYWISLAFYLLFVGFLYHAKENPDAAILTTKMLYYTVGFPLLALIYFIKNIPRWMSKSGETVVNSSAKHSSSNDSTHNNQYPDRETIDIEFQSSSGNWSRLHSFEYLGNDQQISHAMDNAERSAALKGNSVTGRIRAKGRRTKTIYDIR